MNTETVDYNLMLNISSTLIALLAFLLSVGHIVYNLISKKTKLKITIDYSDKHTYKATNYFFVCIISNRSSKSVAITGIKLTTKDGKNILCSTSKELVAYFDSQFDRLNTAQKDFVLYSDEMPISFVPHSSKRCILCFDSAVDKPQIEKAFIYTSNRTYKSKQITNEFSEAFKKL